MKTWKSHQKQGSQAGISNHIPQFTVGCNYVFLPEIPVSGAKVRSTNNNDDFRVGLVSAYREQIGVHETSLSVFLVLEILCSSTKLTFVLTLCVFHVHGVFSMCLAVLYLCINWVHTGFVCVYFEFTLLSSTWWTQNGFKSAHSKHTKNPEHTLVPICWVMSNVLLI